MKMNENTWFMKEASWLNKIWINLRCKGKKIEAVCNKQEKKLDSVYFIAS